MNIGWSNSELFHDIICAYLGSHMCLHVLCMCILNFLQVGLKYELIYPNAIALNIDKNTGNITLAEDIKDDSETLITVSCCSPLALVSIVSECHDHILLAASSCLHFGTTV